MVHFRRLLMTNYYIDFLVYSYFSKTSGLNAILMFSGATVINFNNWNSSVHKKIA